MESEKEMVYKQVKLEEDNENETMFPGYLWKPQVNGETREGVFTRTETDVGDNSVLHHFNEENENPDAEDDQTKHWKMWGSTVLDKLMARAKPGLPTKVIFVGKQKNKTNKYYTNLFEVLQDEDAGGEPSTPSSSSSSSGEPETMDLRRSDEDAVNEIMDNDNKFHKAKKVKKQKKGDWFEKLKDYLPEKNEDLEIPEKRHAEWINRIRSDLIGNGTRKVTMKMIRDNVAILVEDGTTRDHDLGTLDEETGRGIFTLLRKIGK